MIGLLVILGAFGAGSSFTQDGSNGASLGMAVLTAVAMLCYAANLVILGKAGRRRLRNRAPRGLGISPMSGIPR